MPTSALGIGQAFANVGKQLFQGESSYNKGYLSTAKELATIGRMQAQGDYYKTKADLDRRRGEFQTPEYGTKVAASFAGLTGPQAAEMEAYVKNGNWGTNPAYELPDELAGPRVPETPKPAPTWATPEAMGKYQNARTATMLNLAGTGNSDSHNMTQAFVDLLKKDQSDRALNTQGVQGLNALESARGGKMYNFHEFGTGDQSTGGVAFNQPWLDKNASVIAENKAQTASAYSSANNSNASADLHRVQAEAARLKMTQPQVVVGPNGETAVLDPKTGLPMGTPKPTGEYLKQQTGVQNVRQAIANYRTMLGQWNKGQMLSPDARAEMGTAYNNLLLQAKEAYNLGVLNGPDYQILQEVIANPNNFSNALISRGAMDKQASELDRLMQSIGQTSAAVHRQPSPGEVSTAQLPRPAQKKTFKDFGYTSPTQAVLEARALIKERPWARADAIRTLESMGITNHGIK